ncbi:2-acylglycerol O-acyltransferase 2 [Brachionus plicatilis]|uniref:Acyltransferase n=1 Tax=Brachionus plicatilis TaxID=10195 RepID=A0A3M7RE98_BRAPC|nr:2-acylglycerol O-acyltransferase 2 [Brachionus plicatilis]
MKILGIEFAPLYLPLERRLQTLAVLFYVLLFLQTFSIIGFFLFFYLLFTKYFWLSIFYATWYFIDFNRPYSGGRKVAWSRTWSIWKYFKDYFPVKLIKTVDLDPNQNYIFGISPHGVMSFSAMVNFGTDATDFPNLFPGLEPHLITLNGQFYSPLMREFFMMCGACACEEKSLKYILSNKGRCQKKGQVCALLIGGARESNEAYPGNYKFILNRRKGFVRIALETGANLVPVISFGENDAYNTVEVKRGSLIQKIQKFAKKYLNIGLPIIRGRGIFIYNFGLLPYRVPIHTIVGKPIPVKRVEHPTDEQIKKLHEQYIFELLELFEENKIKYLKNPDTKIEIC